MNALTAVADVGLSQQWTQKTAIDASLQGCTPAVDDQNLYFGDLSGTFYALSRADGNVVWRQDHEGALSDSSPVVYEESVYVGSGGGSVYALATADGTTQWSCNGSSTITSSPVVSHGTVYVARGDGALLALDAANGTVRWQTTLGAAVHSELSYASVADAVLVSTTDGRVCARAASDGSELWSRSFGAAVGSSSPVVDDDRGLVYFAADELFAVDVETGEMAWGTSFYGANAGSSPAFDDEYVYVAGGDGTVYAVARPDGPLTTAPAWEFETWDVSIVGDLSLVAGRLIVTSLGGELYVLDTAAGDTITNLTVGCKVRSRPVPVDASVYVAGCEGIVVGFA